jgi:hypothetical protein
MATLKDNLSRWRDAAEIDWFSQFIKAWIPFNAWMTDTFGDLTDRDLLDKVKTGSNVVYNRIVPMLDPSRDRGQDADEFRLQVAELHRLLQECTVEGRRGRVSFETVDLGNNPIKIQQVTVRSRTLRVQRDHPNKGEVTVEITASRTKAALLLTFPNHDRRALEDDPSFQSCIPEHRARLLDLFEAVAPRRIDTVLAKHDAPTSECLEFGNTRFVARPEKIFSALVDVIYSLRNALFHGSITPNTQHNEIYEPAYHIVMRLVRCTI